MKKLSIMAELSEEIFETAKKSTISGPQFTQGSTEFCKKNFRKLAYQISAFSEFPN